MKTLIIILTIALCGCSTSYLRKGDLTAFNSRFIWQTEGFRAVLDTNGVGSIILEKSNPDAQTAAAVTAAAIEAAKKP